MTEALLKLRAEDAEDLQIVSAVLQDAIVPLCDMAYQPDDKSFVFVAQRLRREITAEKPDRICCAVTFSGIAASRRHGFDQAKPDALYELLVLLEEGVSASTSCINMIFSGDARIKLDASGWKLTLEDFGEPWPALCQPCHESKSMP